VTGGADVLENSGNAIAFYAFYTASKAGKTGLTGVGSGAVRRSELCAQGFDFVQSLLPFLVKVAVASMVFTAHEEAEVFKPVVDFDAVTVVDDLALFKGPAEVSGHDESVFQHVVRRGCHRDKFGRAEDEDIPIPVQGATFVLNGVRGAGVAAESDPSGVHATIGFGFATCSLALAASHGAKGVFRLPHPAVMCPTQTGPRPGFAVNGLFAAGKSANGGGRRARESGAIVGLTTLPILPLVDTITGSAPGVTGQGGTITKGKAL
jgi:hypothetical protein